MLSLSSNFLRSTTIIQSPLTRRGTLLLISSSNTSSDNNNLFMPVIDVCFNLKLVYKFKSWGDLIVYFSLTRVPISSSSLSSTELEMVYFQVKMTGYDKKYILPHPPTLASKKSHPSKPTKTRTKNYKLSDYLNLLFRVNCCRYTFSSLSFKRFSSSSLFSRSLLFLSFFWTWIFKKFVRIPL